MQRERNLQRTEENGNNRGSDLGNEKWADKEISLETVLRFCNEPSASFFRVCRVQGERIFEKNEEIAVNKERSKIRAANTRS